MSLKCYNLTAINNQVYQNLMFISIIRKCNFDQLELLAEWRAVLLSMVASKITHV